MDDASVVEKYCESLDYAESVQRASLVRSVGKQVYTDHKLCNPGVQPGRATAGVRDASYHKDRMPAKNWDNIVDLMVKTENVMASFVPTTELRRLNFARQLIGYKTMRATCDGEIILPCQIFGALGFARNVHLSSHRDDDFAKSVVSVHKKGHGYGLSDSIVAYFCFPRLGIAIALRPGDILIFNPCEYHSISSRCKNSEQIYVTTVYLKTLVVGLNDNSRPLTDEQEELVVEYQNNK